MPRFDSEELGSVAFTLHFTTTHCRKLPPAWIMCADRTIDICLLLKLRCLLSWKMSIASCNGAGKRSDILCSCWMRAIVIRRLLCAVVDCSLHSIQVEEVLKTTFVGYSDWRVCSMSLRKVSSLAPSKIFDLFFCRKNLYRDTKWLAGWHRPIADIDVCKIEFGNTWSKDMIQWIYCYATATAPTTAINLRSKFLHRSLARGYWFSIKTNQASRPVLYASSPAQNIFIWLVSLTHTAPKTNVSK